MGALTELQIFYVGNDNRISIRGLKADSVQSGSPLNTSSVTATLIASGGSSVGGSSWPIALTLVSSGEGSGEEVRGSRWEGNLPDSLAVTNNGDYQLELTAVSGDGFKGFWKIPVKGKIRES